jgi:branched-subunit amino acid transport protein
MNAWLMIIGGGVITYCIRLSLILFMEKLSIPTWFKRALRFVPVAVFSALIFQMVFVQDTGMNISPTNPRLISGILAALVAWRTRSILLTILVGMAVLFILQALI